MVCEKISLQNTSLHPTKKIEFDAKWVEIGKINTPNIAQLNPETIAPVQSGGFKLHEPQDAVFSEVKYDRVTIKKLPVLFQKDDALLDIDYIDRKHGLPITDVYTLDQLSDGRMIFSGSTNFSTYDGINFKTYHIGKGFGEVRDFFLGSDEKMWIATDEGCFYLKNDQLFKLTDFGSSGVWRCYEDLSGKIWLATFNEGLYFIEGSSCYNLRKDEQFKEAKSFAEDNEGHLFVSAATGVFKFGSEDTLFYPFDHAIGQSEKLFFWNDQIMLGRFAGGLYTLKEDGFHSLQMGFERFSIYSFDTTSTGLWIGYYGAGIVNLNENLEYQRFGEEHGIQSNIGHKIAADNFGNIWIGDIRSGFSIFKENQFKISNKFNFEGNIDQIFEKNDTSYFFLTSGRPKMIEKDRIYELRSTKTYDNPIFHSRAHVINGNEIWLESYTRGPALFKNKKITFYQFSDLPQERNSHSPIKDKFGRLWTVNFRRNLRFLKNDTIHMFSESNELHDAVIEFSLTDKQGETYFITTESCYWIKQNDAVKYSFKNASEQIHFAFPSEVDGCWLLTNKFATRIFQNQIIESFPIPQFFGENIISAIQFNSKFYASTKFGYCIISTENDNFQYKWLGENYGQHLLSPGRSLHWKDQILLTKNSQVYELHENWNLDLSQKGDVKITGIEINRQDIDPTQKIELNRDDEISLNFQIINWGKEKTNYYRLISNGKEGKFNSFETSSLSFSNLASGNYELEVKTHNSAGDSTVVKQKFYVNPYWYESTWFYVLILISGLVLALLYFKRRINKTKQLNEHLEHVVQLKTKELRHEKKQVEQQLNEKELLLKEINHRVKNNMQMVSSLVELQKSKETNSSNKDSLNQISQRVKALAFAHQHLYLQSQYERINVNDYLQLLIGKLVANLPIQSELEIDAELMLPIEKGQALGLILNELISNSIKHAKPENGLEIKLKITQNNGEVEVFYQDNGAGVNQENPGKNSLGMTLVDSFITRQLNGKYELNTIGNYSIKIIFGK